VRADGIDLGAMAVRERSPLPYLWMLLGSFLFAVMSTLAHDLGPRCDWRITALARSGLALVFAAALARGAGARLVFPGPPTLWVRSLAGSLSIACTFYAQSLMPAPEVLTITNTFPVWIALLSWPLLRERPPAAVWLSVCTGVLGVCLIQNPHLQGGVGAICLAVVASVSTAVAMIGLHRLRQLHPLAIVVHFSAVAVLVCLGMLFLGPGAPDWPRAGRPEVFLRLLGVGLAATGGQWFLTRAFAAGSPARVGLVGLTQIVFAIGLDVAVEGRSLGAGTLVGIGLVMAPTAWVMAGRDPA
jgi:drug/metabolite transporter (DMT)-like permease